MRNKQAEYKIIMSESVIALAEHVGGYVGDGWFPVGGVTFVDRTRMFYQTVYCPVGVRNPVRKPKKRPHKNKPQQTRKGTHHETT